MSSGSNNLYNHKVLSGDVLATSAGTYTTQSGNFMSQMKSIQSVGSKKAARHENTSVGPSSKFKKSNQVSTLSTHQAVNIKTVYGYGGGVLSNSNQNVSMKGHIPISKQLNSTSVVRQNTQ